MHMHPRVRELEERYPDVLTVIGVHAGKFATERVTERIAEACDRLDVRHAVVNDRQFRIWRDFAVNAWPTIVLVDPDGYVGVVAPGEASVEALAGEIDAMVARASAQGTLRRGPDPVRADVPRHEGTLRFPTRTLVDGTTMWIADTGHGRVLECVYDAAAGSAAVSAAYEGLLEPRGLAALDGAVYVADRAGHSIWRIGSGMKERVAGTGELGVSSVSAGGALGVPLRSPWGLTVAGGRLVVSMAGTHQLWAFDPRAGTLELLAGTGGEAIVDGPARRCALAQPTGVAVLPAGGLAFADCESSAVRILAGGAVSTVVGTDLFEFGDRDGEGDRVLLQHCEDVSDAGGILAVADTYNDRLKRVDPVTRTCAAWPGEAGEKGALREPAGVFAGEGALVVADTGHHRLVSVGRDGQLAEIRLL